MRAERSLPAVSLVFKILNQVIRSKNAFSFGSQTMRHLEQQVTREQHQPTLISSKYHWDERRIGRTADLVYPLLFFFLLLGSFSRESLFIACVLICADLKCLGGGRE